MPDTVTLTWILFIGIATGCLFALIVDSALLQKLKQEEKNRQLRLENRLELAKARLKHLRTKLEVAADWQQQANHLLAEKETLVQKLATAEKQICRLEAQVQGTLLQLTAGQKLRQQATTAQAEVKKLQSQLHETKTRLLTLKVQGKEDLTLVRGIGPSYARRLQEGGIRTLVDLALAKPEEVNQIVQLKPWQNVAIDEWIAQARELTAVFSDGEDE